MLADDPEAPTTIDRRFDYGPLTGGRVKVGGTRSLACTAVRPADGRRTRRLNAASAPPRRQASNFLAVAPQRSRTGNSLAVMGPQLGYYYPEIVQQMHLKAPGIQAQGVRAGPGDVHPDRTHEGLRVEPHIRGPRRARRVRRGALWAVRRPADARFRTISTRASVVRWPTSTPGSLRAGRLVQDPVHGP